MGNQHVFEVGDKNFAKEIVSSELPTLVDFWGPACGPCKALEPVIEKLAASYQGKLKVAKVNVDANPQTAIQYGVRSLPTLLLFKGGKVVDQITGRASLGTIESVILKVIDGKPTR
jgi:thioredoxin 1